MATYLTVQVGDIVNVLLENQDKTQTKLVGALVLSITGSVLNIKHNCMHASVDMGKAIVTLAERPVKRFLVFHDGISSNIAYETAEEAHSAARDCYGDSYTIVPLEGAWRL